MAKRVPAEDKPYRPLQESLVRSVAFGPASMPRVPPVERDTPHDVLAFPMNVLPHPLLQPRQHPTPDPAHLTSASRQRREKRVLLTPAEERAFESLVGRLARSLDTPLKPSHVLRASIATLVRAEDELVQQARAIGPLTRPPNGSEPALASFERAHADLIVRALTSRRES